MTDKERLEEIKEDVFKCNHGSTRGYSYEQLYHIALSLVRIHGEWLIEQAGKVQVLEKENKLLRFIAEENKIASEQKVKQNKRYREALEKISRGKITYADSFGMINIARKALEDKK